MQKKAPNGFTLVELEIVLIIIAIFAALAVPQLIEVKRRNKLTDMTNMVQQSASIVRSFALQTRKAAVLEISEGRMWMNVLDGPSCWSNLRAEDRCMHNLGATATATGTNRFDLTASDYLEAGVYLCDVEYGALSGGTCTLTNLGPSAGFGLCYSATGDLYVRPVEDDTGCSGAAVAVAGAGILGRDNWVRSCVVLADGEIPVSGAVISFNRFEDPPASCSAAGVLDVTRAVHVPVGSAPFSKVSP